VAAEASSSRDVDAAHPTVLAQDSLSDVVSGVGATTCIHSVQSSGGHTANNDPRNASAGLDAHGPQDCAAKSKSVGGLRAEYRVDMRCDFRHLMNSNFFNGWMAFENISKIGLSREQRTPFYNQYVCSILWDFINTYAKLAGVFVGSDNQGGNHYGMANPCSYAPTDYVGVIQAAGKNMKVRNLLANCETGTSNGDMAGFLFIKFENTLGSNISFKLSSNVDTQSDQHI